MHVKLPILSNNIFNRFGGITSSEMGKSENFLNKDNRIAAILMS